jgi:acyl carrier protein
MDEISEKARQVLVDTFHLEPEEVTPEANLRNNLGMDSTEVVELAVALEQEFNIDIKDGELSNKQQVADVIRIIRSKLGK